MKQAQRFSPHREWGPALAAQATDSDGYRYVHPGIGSGRQPGVTLNFFGPGSPYLGHPLLTADRTAAEIDEICGHLALASMAGLDVLDVGCGFGRHAIELATRGARVVAVDPSATMIDAAKERVAVVASELGRGLPIEWRVTPGERLADRDAYDLTVCLFTTFGQLPGDAHELLGTLVAATRPGGHVVIEVPERDRAVEMLVAAEVLGRPGQQTQVSRRFDADTSTLHEQFETAAGNTFDLAYRLFGRAELIDLCGGAGLIDINVVDRAIVPPPPTFVTLYASCPNG